MKLAHAFSFGLSVWGSLHSPSYERLITVLLLVVSPYVVTVGANYTVHADFEIKGRETPTQQPSTCMYKITHTHENHYHIASTNITIINKCYTQYF